MLNYNITGQSVTLYFDDDVRTYDRNSAVGKKIVDAIRSGQSDDDLEKIVFAFKNEVEALDKDIRVTDNDCVVFRDESVPRQLGLMMREFANDNEVLDPLMAFWGRLKKNPCPHAIQHFFEASQRFKFPITNSGHTICWKRVKGNINDASTFRDIRTGTILNSPGTIVKMDRKDVNPDPQATCVAGLHVASWDYAHEFYGNGVMLEVLIDAKNVCAVPVDYDRAKIRVCEYRVIKVVEDRRPERVISDEEYQFDDDLNHIL